MMDILSGKNKNIWIIDLFLVSNFRRKRLSFYRLKHVFKTESMIEHDSDPEKG